MRDERACLHGIPIAEIAVVVDHAKTRDALAEKPLGGPVHRAVRHDDELELLVAEAGGDGPADHADVVDDLLAAVVDGDDDAEERSRGRLGHREDGAR